jgi:hypothetical protein
MRFFGALFICWLMQPTVRFGIVRDDFTWLVANLEVGAIKTGVDQETVGEIETFVLGPKAYYAAETYVLADSAVLHTGHESVPLHIV